MTIGYDFPRIRHITDVIPHIDDNFRVVEKDGLTFINYNMMGGDTFPPVTADNYYAAAVRRECRGITFDTTTGDLVSRPFHKFFNAGEREDLALDRIDLNEPHVVLAKLDGSMIRPIPTPAGMRWGTKMGFTDVGMLAEEWVAGRTNYEEFAESLVYNGFTPLFEFCSRRSRIVVDYPQEEMKLLAIRDMLTGVYFSDDALRVAASFYGIPVVGAIDHETGVESLVEVVRGVDDAEGVVIAFDYGHRVKVKSDWYVRVHRAKDMMRSERRLLGLILKEEIDDLLAILEGPDQHRVEVYISQFLKDRARLVIEMEYLYQDVRDLYEDRKSFALSEVAAKMSPAKRKMIFSLWNGKVDNPLRAIMAEIQNGMSSETKFAEVKESLGMRTQWGYDHLKEAA